MCYKVNTLEIKKRMLEKDINTISELAELTGINRVTVSNVINGKARPSTAVIEKLIVALDIPTDMAGCLFFVPDLRNA